MGYDEIGAIFDWYFSLSWKVRLAIPIVLVFANIYTIYNGYVAWWLFFPNIFMFMFCGKTHDEKHGYTHRRR